MRSFTLHDRHGYSLQFSPYEDGNLLAVATSGLYGSTGVGKLHLIEVTNNDDPLNSVCEFEWTDGLFDLSWSKQNPENIATCSGDGTLQIWNIFHPEKRKPLICLQEHTNEVYSIDWNQQILSASWDGSIKLWDPNRLNSIHTYSSTDVIDSVYCACFSTFFPNIFSSVSINGELKFWNSLDFSGRPALSISAHSGEILSCDWNNCNPYIMATGGSDKFIRIWDIRSLKDSLFQCQDSKGAVRRVKFSPFESHLIAVAGYDFTARIWNFMETSDVMKIIDFHSDVVNDISWNSKTNGQVADCGWDSSVNILTLECLRNT